MQGLIPFGEICFASLWFFGFFILLLYSLIIFFSSEGKRCVTKRRWVSSVVTCCSGVSSVYICCSGMQSSFCEWSGCCRCRGWAGSLPQVSKVWGSSWLWGNWGSALNFVSLLLCMSACDKINWYVCVSRHLCLCVCTWNKGLPWGVYWCLWVYTCYEGLLWDVH